MLSWESSFSGKDPPFLTHHKISVMSMCHHKTNSWYLIPVYPSQGLAIRRYRILLCPIRDLFHSPSIDSNVSTSIPENTLCSVDTAGVLSLLEPSSLSVSGDCIIPHWPMA